MPKDYERGLGRFELNRDQLKILKDKHD